jgi:hypothetical protein
MYFDTKYHHRIYYPMDNSADLYTGKKGTVSDRPFFSRHGLFD